MKMAIRVEGRRRALMTSTFVLLGLMSFTALAGVMLSAGQVSAETATTNTVSIDMLAACSFSAGGGQYSGKVVNGQSIEITGDVITAACNDASGYAIYAIGYSGELYDGDYHTDMLSSLGNSYNIKTNGVGTDSYWKMKITNPNNATVSGNFGTYQQIPSTFTQVATYGSNVATASITPKYEIYASTSQPSGTYTGKVKYTLVHPNTMVAGTYNIAYNANGGTGTMTGSTGLYNFEEFTMPTSTFTAPSDYTFAGWCTTNTAGSYACDGTSYAAGDTATSLASAGSTATLYAYWEEIPKYMQDLTLANCPTTITTVYDKRDETPYRVQKLADDKCWMLDNLALDLTALTQAQLYGTGDNAGKMTNASNEALGYLKGATTGTARDKWAMAAVKKTWTSSYSYSQPWIAVDSTTSGGCNNAYCVDGGAAGSPWSYDSETSETINGVTSIVQGKIGVYYNYCAASAGSYCWGSTGTSSSGSPSSDPVADSIRDITDDICPYKWRLPTGGSSGEFQNLYSKYSGGSPSQVAAFQTALSTPLSGYFNSGKAYYQGNYGYFWSSTWNFTDLMYFLSVSSSNVIPSSLNTRVLGYSVRCILAE